MLPEDQDRGVMPHASTILAGQGGILNEENLSIPIPPSPMEAVPLISVSQFIMDVDGSASPRDGSSRDSGIMEMEPRNEAGNLSNGGGDNATVSPPMDSRLHAGHTAASTSPTESSQYRVNPGRIISWGGDEVIPIRSVSSVSLCMSEDLANLDDEDRRHDQDGSLVPAPRVPDAPRGHPTGGNTRARRYSLPRQ